MKKLATLLLAAGLVFGAATGASAIDFKAKGQWLVGFGVGDGSLTGKEGGQRTDDKDKFAAGQRIRLQLDAVASENLSGTVYFEIGSQKWGEAGSGGALGADGKMVKVKRAYLDWVVPQTDLSFRMGIQGLAMPNAAGGSAIMDTDVGAVNASYKFNDNVGLTAFWARPANDNFTASEKYGSNRNGYLDNMDLFGLTLPLTFDGVEATPWVMYGVLGKNALDGYNNDGTVFTRNSNYDGTTNKGWYTADGMLTDTLLNTVPGVAPKNLGKGKAYTSMFFAGLPVKVSAFEPLNIEFDFNYGYVEGIGRYDIDKRGGVANGGSTVRANTKRAGWLAKALVEYKMDWGVPGIFGWYASGDDGNMKNGSERMPSIAGCGNFTSFMGDGNWGWAAPNNGAAWYDKNMTYAGTWGVGLQVRDMSFVEDLKHTLRVAYWGGTNSPSMTKYFDSKAGWKGTSVAGDGPYLTTNDGLLEFNLVNAYQIYENLEMNLELGYIVNMVDKGTWDRSWMTDKTGVSKQDAWKAQLIFAYTF